MKRSGMPPRRTPMPRATSPMKRTRLKAARAPMPRVSDRRKRERPERAAVRAVVIERDGGMCVGWGMPGVPHDHATPFIEPGAEEVHELLGGSARSTSYLNPALCITLCHAANGWISNGSPREAERRGLRLPLDAGGDMRAEAVGLRASWRRGVPVDPSWFGPVDPDALTH